MTSGVYLLIIGVPTLVLVAAIGDLVREAGRRRHRRASAQLQERGSSTWVVPMITTFSAPPERRVVDVVPIDRGDR